MARTSPAWFWRRRQNSLLPERYKPREGEVDRFAQSPNLTTVPVWTHSLKFAPARRRRQRARCGPDWRCAGYLQPALAALSADPRMHSPLDVEGWALEVFTMKRFAPLIAPAKLLRDFPATRCYLIGVSGGRDSIALLDLLLGFGYEKLVVCHLDHRLRDAASRADARFVEKVARNLGLDCEIGSVDVGALAKRSKLSIETAGRFARLAFFVEVARRWRCS